MSVVAVCGASGGIGAALCRAFTAAGWTVAAGARRVERLEALVADGAAAVAHALDVTDPAGVDAFFSVVEEQAGPVDCVIANAGVAVPGALADASDADVRRVIDTNLYGSLTVVRRAIPGMRDRCHGDVVFVSSDSVEKPYPQMLTYGATKAAVEYVASGLRLELAGTGVRATVARLGPTLTEFGTDWDPAAVGPLMRAWKRHGVIPDHAVIQPADAADAVVAAVSLTPGIEARVVSLGPVPAVVDATEAASAKQSKDG